MKVAVHEGDVIAEVARRVGKEQGLAADGVTQLQQLITRKAAEVLGERSVKTEFFNLPVTVETASGEQQVVVLTVYEESDPVRLSTMFAEKYGLPRGLSEQIAARGRTADGDANKGSGRGKLAGWQHAIVDGQDR